MPEHAIPKNPNTGDVVILYGIRYRIRQIDINPRGPVAMCALASRRWRSEPEQFLRPVRADALRWDPPLHGWRPALNRARA